MTAAESSRSGKTGKRLAAPALAILLAPLLWFLRQRLRPIATLAIAIALIFAPLPLGPAHDPVALAVAEMERHAALQAEIAEHGHAHDDGHDHEQSSGHMHGHDPADHSHQSVFVACSASQWSLPPAQCWPSTVSEIRDPATASGIDRPPKHIPT